MTEHNIHSEPQPIADQWMLSCSCGWRVSQPLYFYIGPGAQLIASATRHKLISEHLLRAGREAGGCGPTDVTRYFTGEHTVNVAIFEMTNELPEASVVFMERRIGSEALVVARGEPSLLEIRMMADKIIFRYAVPLCSQK